MEINKIDHVHKVHRDNFNTMMNKMDEKEQNFIECIRNNIMSMETSSTYTNLILKTHKVFDSFNDLQRQQLTKQQDIEYVIKEAKTFDKDFDTKDLEENSKISLKEAFGSFCTQFERQVNRYQKNPNLKTLTDIKSEIQDLGLYLKNDAYFSKGDQGLGKK